MILQEYTKYIQIYTEYMYLYIYLDGSRSCGILFFLCIYFYGSLYSKSIFLLKLLVTISSTQFFLRIEVSLLFLILVTGLPVWIVSVQTDSIHWYTPNRRFWDRGKIEKDWGWGQTHFNFSWIKIHLPLEKSRHTYLKFFRENVDITYTNF